MPLLIFGIACGTPGAPQPPSLRLPKPVDNLSGERKGTRVVLTWTQPTQTTDKQNIRRPVVTRICRAVDQFPMASCREVVKELTASEMTSLPSSGNAKPKVVFEAVISPQQMGPHQYAAYAIEVLNDRSRSAGLSNQVRIPFAMTLPPPSDLTVEVTPSGPVLHWTGQSRAQIGPANQLYSFRYRVFRRIPGESNYVQVGEAQLDGPKYIVPDTSFEWEHTYEYKVASVTEILQPAVRTQNEIEGDDSAIARVMVHDAFPPATPTGLQAVYSGVGQKLFIDLSWAPNTEADLAGYIVFRHEQGQPPVALNKDPVKAPAFRDDSVSPGHTYYYSARSVDVRGNASELSAETHETVPEARQ